MVLHLDHHVVEDLVLCDLAPKDYSPQGVVTSGGLQLDCGVCCSLHVYATLVGVLGRGLSDALHIPAGFRAFRRIPVPFQWNLPAKISLLPRNFDIPIISLEQSPELTGTEWHWNPLE